MNGGGDDGESGYVDDGKSDNGDDEGGDDDGGGRRGPGPAAGKFVKMRA